MQSNIARQQAEAFIRAHMTSYCRTLREGAKYLVGKLTCYEIPHPAVWHEVNMIAAGM